MNYALNDVIFFNNEMKPASARRVNTVCPGCSDPFYIVTYYIKWVTTSWTYSSILQILSGVFWFIWTKFFSLMCTQCLKIYRKSILHLLKNRFSVYLKQLHYRFAVNFGTLSMWTIRYIYMLARTAWPIWLDKF